MSLNHKEHTDLKNWIKIISHGNSVSCAICIFLLCCSLKCNKRNPKAICHFVSESENTKGEEIAQHEIIIILFHSDVFWTRKIFPNRFGSTLGWRLQLVLRTSDLIYSPPFIRWYIAPMQSTPQCRTEVSLAPCGSEPAGGAGFDFSRWSQLQERGCRWLFSSACAFLLSFCMTSRPGWGPGFWIRSPLRDGKSLLTVCEQQNQCRGSAHLAS